VAHHKAKNAAARQKIGLVDHSPYSTTHARANRSVEHSPYKTLSHYTEYFIVACRVEGKSPNTLEDYSTRLKRYIGTNGDVPADAVSALDIRAYLSKLQSQGLQQTTVRSHYKVLKTFFNWLIAEELLDKNPMSHVKPPKLPKKMVHPFSPDDIEKLLILTSGNTFLDVRNRAIILMFLDTGVRLSEMAAFTLADLDVNSGLIRVTGKGNKERVVRVGQRTLKALLRYLLMRDDNYPAMWLTEEGTPLHRDGINIMVRRLTARAGITRAKRGPHTFRHTAALAYYRNGGDIDTLQIMLGHSSTLITREYLSTIGADDMIAVHKKVSPVDNLKIRF
jgi:site-specific recombinase XerD